MICGFVRLYDCGRRVVWDEEIVGKKFSFDLYVWEKFFLWFNVIVFVCGVVEVERFGDCLCGGIVVCGVVVGWVVGSIEFLIIILL